jgi:hypothetical protein
MAQKPREVKVTIVDSSIGGMSAGIRVTGGGKADLDIRRSDVRGYMGPAIDASESEAPKDRETDGGPSGAKKAAIGIAVTVVGGGILRLLGWA